MMQAMQEKLSQTHCKDFCSGDILASHIRYITSVSFVGKGGQ
jgi:hypothetical protein